MMCWYESWQCQPNYMKKPIDVTRCFLKPMSILSCTPYTEGGVWEMNNEKTTVIIFDRATSMCIWTTTEPMVRLLERNTGLSPPVIYYWPFQSDASVVIYSQCQCSSTFFWFTVKFILYIIVENPEAAAGCLNIDFGKMSRWAASWLVSFNPVNNEAFLLFGKLNKPYHPPVFMQNHQITEVESHMHLGVCFAKDWSWHQHIEYIKQKALIRINIMRKLTFKLGRKAL